MRAWIGSNGASEHEFVSKCQWQMLSWEMALSGSSLWCTRNTADGFIGQRLLFAPSSWGLDGLWLFRARAN